MALAPLLVAAEEPLLVPDVSQREVEIAYSFTGAELLLFGAIIYPGGQAPDGQADIVVVLKGPPQSILVREKRKLGGLIWTNADSARFRSAPSFYAVASSRPIDKIVDERTAAIYELGLGNIHLSPASGSDPVEAHRFETGFVDLRTKGKLYIDRPGAVDITSKVLYRARLSIPARVIVGRYTAETFLIRNGKVIAAATRNIDVQKAGFERFVARSANRWPVTYGAVAILMSLAFGWAAGRVFQRS